MEPQGINREVDVKHCFHCHGDTVFYCHVCRQDLCQGCKETHTISLDTKRHNVTVYRMKYNYLLNQELCLKHPNEEYKQYCESCEIPICINCMEHRAHQTIDFRTACETKRQQNKETKINIECETLYEIGVLKAGFKSDVNYDVRMFKKDIRDTLMAVVRKSQRLNDLIESILTDFNYKHRCLMQKFKITRYIETIQHYESRYEMFANRPVQFLRLIKMTSIPQVQNTPKLSQHTVSVLTLGISLRDVMQLFCEIKVIKKGKRQVRNDRLLKVLLHPILKNSITVTFVARYHHISLATSDRIWVSDDKNKLFLTDTATGNIIHCVTDSCGFCYGFHTVNSEDELIYIDKNGRINKISKDLQTTTEFIKRTSWHWEPQCVYYSPSTGFTLVGHWTLNLGNDTDIGKVTWHNNNGQLERTVPCDNTDQTLLSYPCYITENQNGDVVVSDLLRGVVVMKRDGRYRFTYTGPSSESKLVPCGICTDALSNILVCDGRTKTVQLINKDGQFLSNLLTTESPGLEKKFIPWSIGYALETHLLWVGSGSRFPNNSLLRYRHITRHHNQ
uniref:Uncharacterized protein LOC111105224 n=1 Tax=Crassostrea virginica TaxID=6565 RepID=A0A8B8AUW2_CRAVI|nr:uncharacterized protein LOC111105224 [Crassostrea virginica]